MRARLRNDPDQSRKQDHKGGIVADPSVDLDMLQTYSDDQQHTEGPCEYGRHMPADNMIPQMFIHKMVGRKQKNQQHNDTQSRKKHIHPVLRQQIERHAVVLFAGFAMNMFMVFMSLVSMSSVRRMVVPELPARKSCNEYGKSHEHHYPLPSEMALLSLMFMDHISVAAGGFHPAVAMFMKPACTAVPPVVEDINDNSRNDGDDEKDGKKNKGLLRDHRKHHERLVAR